MAETVHVVVCVPIALELDMVLEGAGSLELLNLRLGEYAIERNDSIDLLQLSHTDIHWACTLDLLLVSVVRLRLKWFGQRRMDLIPYFKLSVDCEEAMVSLLCLLCP